MKSNSLSDIDVDRLADALQRDFPDAKPSQDRAWSRSPALRVIDCVLSLNRRYDDFVVPRLDRFEHEQPHVTSIHSLRALVDSYQSPADFSIAALHYNHRERAEILSKVIDFCLGIVTNAPADTEEWRLQQWAQSAEPKGYSVLGIPGFALSGFQYLRMLFGANTAKPDVHIRDYVSAAVNRRVSDLEALYLLEAAARKRSISLRNADTNIWERSARGIGILS